MLPISLYDKHFSFLYQHTAFSNITISKGLYAVPKNSSVIGLWGNQRLSTCFAYMRLSLVAIFCLTVSENCTKSVGTQPMIMPYA